jgi:predicted glutamine amidotransferase
MCRILLIKTTKKINPQKYLHAFAEMSEKSRALDGDWQGDGYGISWLQNNSWNIQKSTDPIWKDISSFENIPDSKIFMVHARSATYKSKLEEGDTSYNQPYIADGLSYVFNGHLKGVRLKRKVAGKVGAEKLFNLFLEFYKSENNIFSSIRKLNHFIKENVNQILAMNYGVSDKKNIYATCNYSPNKKNPDYHKLHVYSSQDLKIITSEPILDFTYQKMAQGEIIAL